MSQEYAEKRIREALKLARGNSTRARQHVMAWTFEDPRLLLALAQPHLTGIIAHAIGRVVHKQEKEEAAAPVPETTPALDMAPSEFGQEVLKALQSGNTARFGLEKNAAPVRRKQASQSHIDAMKKLAGKSSQTPPDSRGSR